MKSDIDDAKMHPEFRKSAFYQWPKHPGCKNSSDQELKKGLDKTEMKSKWVAKACVVLLLMEIKFLIITIQAAKH